MTVVSSTRLLRNVQKHNKTCKCPETTRFLGQSIYLSRFEYV